MPFRCQGDVFRQLRILLLAAAVLQLTGCGPIRRAAINTATGAFAGGKAAEVYSSDDDPELVADAMPFALKTYEVLIAGDPTNREFHRSAAAGFVQYSAAFVETEADLMEDEDYEKPRFIHLSLTPPVRTLTYLPNVMSVMAVRSVLLDSPNVCKEYEENDVTYFHLNLCSTNVVSIWISDNSANSVTSIKGNILFNVYEL